MATAIFVMLPEPGHFNPSFKLAKGLQERGHKVYYLGAQDCESDIRSQGLEFIPVFKEALPLGYQSAIALNASVDPTFKGDVSIRNLIADQMRIVYGHKREIVELAERLHPDLFIVDTLLPAMALVGHEIGIPGVFLNVTFNAFDDYQGTAALTPILKVPEVILCPQVFDLPRVSEGPRRRFFIEPSIDLQRAEVPFPWDDIRKDKPLIYCSLGTQSHFYKEESKRLYRCVIEAMESRDNWQLILSVGTHSSVHEFPRHANVILVNRAPQLEVLKRASIMITHGGLGSIKECILFGVPMIVFPLGRDQPLNAARVVYHKLGVRGDIKHVSTAVIQLLIDKLDRMPSFKAHTELMAEKFREMESLQRGVKLVERMMGVLEQRAPRKAISHA